MMDKVIDKIFEQFKGPDLWIVLGFAVLWIVGAALLKSTKQEQRQLRRQIIFGVAVVAVASVVIAGRHWASERKHKVQYTFPPNVSGILVLQLHGDDDRSLQRHLTSTLNTEIANASPVSAIQVRAIAAHVDESIGLPASHQKARILGKRFGAKLVVWGTRVGDKGFHPRITIVEEHQGIPIWGSRALSVQGIGDVALPVEMVNQPIYLLNFALGYSALNSKDYGSAANQFAQALARKNVAEDEEFADLNSFCGYANMFLAQGGRHVPEATEKAVRMLTTAAQIYDKQGLRSKWASTQANLANALRSLRSGDPSENLQKAIRAYEAALTVHTEKAFPKHWIAIQNDLAQVYTDLPTGNRSDNLQKAIKLYEAALHVSKQNALSNFWARVKNNLGTAYMDVPTGDRAQNVQNAIAAYEDALGVLTEQDLDWPGIRNNLGNAYLSLPIGDPEDNFLKAVKFFQAGLRVANENKLPLVSALIEGNLGRAFHDRARHTVDLAVAKAHIVNALSFYSETDFPTEHEGLKRRLLDIMAKLLHAGH